MAEIDSYLQEFIQRTDANIKSLFDLVKGIEAAQSEHKKRLWRLENGGSRGEKEDIELEHVNNIFYYKYLINIKISLIKFILKFKNFRYLI